MEMHLALTKLGHMLNNSSSRKEGNNKPENSAEQSRVEGKQWAQYQLCKHTVDFENDRM